MAEEKAVKQGDKVKVDYTGKLDDGTVFDTSEGKTPIEFEVGGGKIIKGFSDAVIGMKQGEEKEIKLTPDQAYGERREELKQVIPKDKIPKLPENVELKKGMMLTLKAPTGMTIPARIADVTEENVTIDLNHPLAGKNLNFKIKVVEIL